MVLAHWQREITIISDGALVPLSAGSVEVRHETSGLPLASIFSDRDGATPITNPFNFTDGEAEFYVEGGAYQIYVTDGASLEKTYNYVAIGLASENDPDDLAAAMALGTAAFEDVGTDDGELPVAEDVDVLAAGLVTIADSASTTFNADDGITKKARLTATGDRTLTAPTNATIDGQKVIIEHVASGADRTLTLTTGSAGAFRFSADVPSLSATASGKRDLIGVMYDATDDRWDVIAYVKGVG